MNNKPFMVAREPNNEKEPHTTKKKDREDVNLLEKERKLAYGTS